MIVIGKRPGVVYGVRFGQDAVAVRFRVSHGESAYPDPVKATQPDEEVLTLIRRLELSQTA